ncbi:hypothetical protein AVEN_56083-1, partial [Araneus ventricosus]
VENKPVVGPNGVEQPYGECTALVLRRLRKLCPSIRDVAKVPHPGPPVRDPKNADSRG